MPAPSSEKFLDALLLRTSEDGRVTRLAQSVVILSLAFALMNIVPLAAAVYLLPGGYSEVLIISFVICALLLTLPLFTLATRNPTLSAWALCMFMAAMLTALGLISGGVSSVIMPMFIVPVIWGWFLLGRIGGYVFFPFMLVAIVLNWFYSDTVNGTLPALGPGEYGILQSIILSVTITACSLAGYLANRNERLIHRDLVSARDAARRANLEKSALIAGMAHEIRTPLTGLSGMLELLSHEALSESQSEMAATAKASSRNILTLINDLLDMSKLELGELKLLPEATNISQLFRDLTREFQYPSESKHLTYIVNGPDEDVWVLADPVRFSQILSNYLSNAIKFTDTGSISAVLSVAAPKNGKSRVRLAVSDTGAGIPADMVNRVFDRFVQVEAAQKASHSGTGIGLAIVHDLARIQDGRVWAESVLGKGSTFYFETEFESVAFPDVLSSDQKSPTAHEHQATILLADDNPGNQRVLTTILQRLGYLVITARNGAEAVKCLHNSRIDLVLMDYYMPELDGPDALKEIRKTDSPFQNVPVIGLSADHTEANLKRWADADVTAVLSKPIDFSSLEQSIRRLLQS